MMRNNSVGDKRGNRSPLNKRLGGSNLTVNGAQMNVANGPANVLVKNGSKKVISI